MPKSLSLATAVDKNRIASDNVYLLLLEVDIMNAQTGKLSETIYIVNNNENVTFGGTEYQAIPFECELTQDKDTAPTATLTVYDFTQSIIAALTTEGGLCLGLHASRLSTPQTWKAAKSTCSKTSS